MSLAETQQRLWRLVTAPSGIAEALRDESDRAPAGASSSHSIDGLIKSDRQADATARLDVYASAYFYRIHGVLEKDYPALAAALGSDGFNDLVTSYLLVKPPTHPSLRYAGASLADFLAGHEAAKGMRQRSPWASDLARFEWAMIDAFDARDSERLSRETIAALPPARFAEISLALRPGSRFLALDWPVRAMRTAFDADEAVRPPEAAAASAILVWRVAERVRYRTPDANEASTLPLLERGVNFAQLCEHLARGGDESTVPAIAAGLLERWLADGVLVDVA